MPRYEYKVVPAPTKGLKGKGVKGAEARFSHAIQELMNGLAGYGWEYQRAETLPSIERAGLTGTTTEWRNVLVFRRLRESDAEAFAPQLLPTPAAVAAMPVEPVLTRQQAAPAEVEEALAELEETSARPVEEQHPAAPEPEPEAPQEPEAAAPEEPLSDPDPAPPQEPSDATEAQQEPQTDDALEAAEQQRRAFDFWDGQTTQETSLPEGSETEETPKTS